MLQAFMGLGGTYDPDMVSIIRPIRIWCTRSIQTPSGITKATTGLNLKQMINSLGFRGKETTVEKPDHVFRIVCLGGSTTFGLGEPDETQTYRNSSKND